MLGSYGPGLLHARCQQLIDRVESAARLNEDNAQLIGRSFALAQFFGGETSEVVSTSLPSVLSKASWLFLP